MQEQLFFGFNDGRLCRCTCCAPGLRRSWRRRAARDALAPGTVPGIATGQRDARSVWIASGCRNCIALLTAVTQRVGSMRAWASTRPERTLRDSRPPGASNAWLDRDHLGLSETRAATKLGVSTSHAVAHRIRSTGPRTQQPAFLVAAGPREGETSERVTARLGQPSAAASTEAEGLTSGRRIIRAEFMNPSRPARIGMSSAT